MKFYIDRKWEACNMGAAYRSWSWSGYKLGDKMTFLWSAHQDLQNINNFVAKIRKFALRTITLNAFDLTEENTKKYILILKKFRQILLIHIHQRFI